MTALKKAPLGSLVPLINCTIASKTTGANLVQILVRRYALWGLNLIGHFALLQSAAFKVRY